MDLNYLLKRHQISVFAAQNAACLASRRAHHDFALGYANRIRTLQAGLGATALLACGL